MNTSVVFNNVTKKYKMYKKTSDKLLDLALPNGYGKDFYALQDVNFTAEMGDVIGIIGVNGAGKSTMSNLISGVIPPTSGSIEINGDAALISIGAGLNNELTGRENIELKCLMLGFKKEEIQQLMPEIIDFADIGEFIDQPVKKYSSGMKSRLGFAISVNIDPDILVIDEALSVGDKTFYQKCLDKMNSFKEKGKTIFFISHSASQVKEFCQKALWLEAGEVKAYGPVDEIIPQYEKFIKNFNKLSKEEKKQFNQRLMEKRGGNEATINNSNPGPKPNPKPNPDPSLGNRTRVKKPKQKSMLFFNSLLVVVLLIGAALLLLKWNHVVAYFQTDKSEHVLNVEKEKEEQTEAQQKTPDEEAAVEPVKDVRYMQMVTGFVRDMPDLENSTKITMLNFGDPIVVEQTQKDPMQDFNWLQFTLPNGQQGWISERLVSKVDIQSNESDMVSAVGSMIDFDLGETLALFGKTEEEVAAAAITGSEQLSYNSNGEVNSVSITFNESVSRDALIEMLGEPILRQEENAYMYHGEEYDFIFYTGNGVSFREVTVRAAI
jgi:teichoic acid transport system ATP-binding protein